MRIAFVVVASLAGCGPGGSSGPDGPSGPGDGAGSDGVVGTSQVQIVVEPSHGTELVTAISGAQHSVDMTMYEISDQRVIDALVARAHAGVAVRAILDGSTTNRSWNTDAYDQLTAAGASVVWSNPAFTFTHEKCVIVDRAQAWIMTMNANISSPTSNREYLAIDTDPADVAEATAVFEADHAMQAITPAGTLVVANANARAKLVALINSASHAVDVEGEEFSDTATGGVVDALTSAAARGIAVRIVIANGSQTTSETAAIARVKHAGAQVVISGPTSSNGTLSNPYIHAKAMVVDCAGGICTRGFVGSENFSAGSLGYNRELGVIFDAKAELAMVETAIDADFGRGVAQ